jgi:hypothetical protein
MPEDLRERLVVSPDQLYELREAAHRHREALSEKVTLGGSGATLSGPIRGRAREGLARLYIAIRKHCRTGPPRGRKAARRRPASVRVTPGTRLP